MGRADWDLDPIVDRLHGAALDPASWSSVLDDLTRTAGAAGAILFSTDSRMPGRPVSQGLEAMMEAYFREGWCERDERFRAAPALLRNGVNTDRDAFAAGASERSPFYRDFLARQGLKGFAGVGFQVAGDFWCIALQRKLEQGEFEPAELRKLRSLWRPLTDAASLARQFGFAAVQGVADAMALMRQAAVVLDERAEVMAMNAPAEAEVAKLFDVVDRRMRLADGAAQMRLETLMRRSLARPLDAEAGPAVVALKDRFGRVTTLRLVSLRNWSRFAFSNARWLILLGSPQSQGDPLDDFARRYGLTPAEGRLAAALAEGRSLAACAEELAIAYETARTRLKAIFAKTSVHRQGELIALLHAHRNRRDLLG